MADLPMTPLKSSMLSGYSYDPTSRRLIVEFNNGGRYAYEDVDAAKVETLAGNKSPGSFFSSRIKGLHPATKL